MADDVVEFEAKYSDELIRDAAMTYVRFAYRTFLGWKFFAAGIICVIGFAASVYFGADGVLIFAIAVILGPALVYFPIMFFVYPGKIAQALKAKFQPTAKITIGSSGFSVASNNRQSGLPWTDLRAVLEFAEYFIFVANPYAFVVIPRSNMPTAAEDIIHRASARVAAVKKNGAT